MSKTLTKIHIERKNENIVSKITCHISCIEFPYFYWNSTEWFQQGKKSKLIQKISQSTGKNQKNQKNQKTLLLHETLDTIAVWNFDIFDGI